MHHKNHHNSTSNHNSPQHEKPGHMHAQYGRNDMPGPQRPKKTSVLNRIRERFQEKPATPEEVRQLQLNAKRETYKTQIQRAKSSRPSKWDNLGGGGGSPSYRRSSPRGRPQESGLFGGGGGGSWLMGNNSSPGFSMFQDTSQKPKGRKQQSSGLGQGLSDLF